MDEEYDSISEESEDANMDIKSDDSQKYFNKNLINSLKSEEVQSTVFKILDFYYESNNNSHYNFRINSIRYSRKTC